MTVPEAVALGFGVAVRVPAQCHQTPPAKLKAASNTIQRKALRDRPDGSGSRYLVWRRTKRI